MKKQLKLILSLLILQIFISNTAIAGTILKYNKTVESNMQGMNTPASGTLSVVKISDSKMRVDDGKLFSCIILLDKNVMYLLTHQNKTYVELSLNSGDFQNKLKDEMKKQMGKEAEVDPSVFTMPQIKLKVKEVGEKKKIKNWNCAKYIQTMQMNLMGNQETVTELWTTEDIKINVESYSKFAAAMLSTMTMQAGGVSEEILNETKKLKGITVISVTTANMMGQKIKNTEELIEAKEIELNDSDFQIPSNYKKNANMFGGME
ncbi:MAG TPA: DUF4412 domain-containing protein [bacterium]|nr:DUF4412 domain-containing protein [bacterium]HPN32187.1 DUF4412 domain-containing protein [bacterium]